MALDLYTTDASERVYGSSAVAAIDLPDAHTPETLAAAAERTKLIRACVGGLTAEHRRIIALLYEQDLSLEQAARELGVSKVAVHKMHQRALARLRTSLELMAVDSYRELAA